MNRLTVGAALAVVALTVTTGCTDDSSATTPPTLATSPLPTPTITTTSAPTTPPPTTSSVTTPPPSAERPTLAGAKAFVRFYIDAINQAYKSGSGAVLRSHSTQSCISCRGIASSVELIRKNHGFYHGGDWIVTFTTPVARQSLTKPIIIAAIDVQSGEWKRSSTDHLQTIAEDKIHVTAYLVRAEGKWLTRSMVMA